MNEIKHTFACMWWKIPKWLRNKYAITFLAFFIWIFFLDQYSMIDQFSYYRKTKQLEKEKIYFQKKLTIAKEELKELTTNNKALERYAREKYYMKRPNEDVFVLVPKKDK